MLQGPKIRYCRYCGERDDISDISFHVCGPSKEPLKWWIVWKYKGGELKPYGFNPIPKNVEVGDEVYEVVILSKKRIAITSEDMPI